MFIRTRFSFIISTFTCYLLCHSHRPFSSREMKANKMESLPGRNSLVWLILSLYCLPILNNWRSQFSLKINVHSVFKIQNRYTSVHHSNLGMCLIICVILITSYNIVHTLFLCIAFKSFYYFLLFYFEIPGKPHGT